MDHKTLIIVAVLAGLAAGSAITALADRLLTDAPTWVTGRSRCPLCKKELRALDLIPLLSFFALRGRCRSCAKPISWSYPVIEAVTAFLFFASAATTATPGAVIRNWIIIFILLTVFIVDARASVIPDELMLPALVFAVIWSVVFHAPEPRSMMMGAIAGGGFFAAQYFISRGRWIGDGDIRLGAFLGAILGWPLVIPALLISYWIGALGAIGLVAAGKKKWGSEIPFGTFLAAGGIIMLFAGGAFAKWYAGFF